MFGLHMQVPFSFFFKQIKLYFLINLLIILKFVIFMFNYSLVSGGHDNECLLWEMRSSVQRPFQRIQGGSYTHLSQDQTGITIKF